MVISYQGEGGFRFQNGNVSLLVDPPSNRLKADVVLRTTGSVDEMVTTPGEIGLPGEYEVNGIEVSGLTIKGASKKDVLAIAYSVYWEGIHFGILGEIKEAPEAEVLDLINGSDVLIVPIGKKELSAEQAAKLIKQIEPSIAIPRQTDNAQELLKILEQKAEMQDKFVFKKKDIEGERGRVVILKSGND
jgi:L-ascorbate metabolism protein UlaG (beta-lactamase superfamily)